MILSLFQTYSPAGNLSAGIREIETALDQASKLGANILVMPELFLPGYLAVKKRPPKNWQSMVEKIGQLCKKRNVGLAIGLPEFVNNNIYNSAYFFSSAGTLIAKHRKIQLFGTYEKNKFTPGDQVTSFDYDGIRFGLLICYDVEFPEHVRNLAKKSVDVILVPTANMMPYVNVNKILVPARAAENGITIVYANYCGSEKELNYVGLSAIYGQDGFTLTSAEQKPGLISIEINGQEFKGSIPTSTQLKDFLASK